MQNKNEAELVAGTKQRDHDAYTELVSRYKNAIYHHCFAMVRDEDAAEDIAQDTFIAAYEKLHMYDPTYRLSTWLFKIATNKALDYLKHPARRAVAGDKLLATIASSQPGPAVEAVHTELRDAVQKLRPNYRAVISLYYWQGLSYEEVAQAMGSPTGSVKVWMIRAKDQLRKELS